ncbi:hypothetical protein Tco_1370132 [Tanacetum coccineum]
MILSWTITIFPKVVINNKGVYHEQSCQIRHDRDHIHKRWSSPYETYRDIGSSEEPVITRFPYTLHARDKHQKYVEAALQAPPSPDYVPGPEEPEQAPPSPDYVPGPEHADDEIVVEDQPYTEEASPTTQSPDYVPETDPEADLEEDDDEDPEEDPIDYPADGGDDGDDEMDIAEDRGCLYGHPRPRRRMRMLRWMLRLTEEAE